MRFEPILHNLLPTDTGFKECQIYNRLIGARPIGPGSLTTKIENLKLWELECKSALESVREILK